MKIGSKSLRVVRATPMFKKVDFSARWTIFMDGESQPIGQMTNE
ncbi:MAG: hypothetical protein ACREE6_05635 [Limisphaerales bacterium]